MSFGLSSRTGGAGSRIPEAKLMALLPRVEDSGGVRGREEEDTAVPQSSNGTKEGGPSDWFPPIFFSNPGDCRRWSWGWGFRGCGRPQSAFTENKREPRALDQHLRKRDTFWSVESA